MLGEVLYISVDEGDLLTADGASESAGYKKHVISIISQIIIISLGGGGGGERGGQPYWDEVK